MAVDLPITGHSTARELAQWFADEQLARSIAYLELVLTEKIKPGPEIEKLLGENSCVNFRLEEKKWEIEAVQRRLAFALCVKRNIPEYPISRVLRNSADGNCVEVLRSYNTRR